MIGVQAVLFIDRRVLNVAQISDSEFPEFQNQDWSTQNRSTECADCEQ